MTPEATILEFPSVTDWRDSAECRGYPTDWWFPEKSDGPAGYDKARTVCATCPVTGDCLTHALHAPETRGMWGGLTQPQLVAIRRRHHIRPATGTTDA